MAYDLADRAESEAARDCCGSCGCPNNGPSLGGKSWGLSFGEDMTPGEGGAITGVVTTSHL